MIFFFFIATVKDAVVAMAEKIAGTEEAFVKLMNDKVRKLGLKNTNFVNSTGLDAENHYSSAYDMAMMAKELIKHEKILEFSSIYEDYLRKNTDNSFWLVNTNKLVRFYSYIDGLKTGFTSKAGYCLTATGKKNGMRLITVVMNEDNTDNRTKDTIAMMDYGFNMYSLDKVIKKDEILGNIKINLGKKEYEDIVSMGEITVLNNNQNNKRNVTYDVVTNEVSAPVKNGDVVGKINIYEDGKYKYSVDVTVMNDVDKANIFMIFLRNLKDIISINI